MPLIDPHLAELLVCPFCQGKLDAHETVAQLRCRDCGRAYPVRDFPIMMPDLDVAAKDAPTKGEAPPAPND
jgi:uncharacterized protein YbaR (Trm112 family)